MHAFKGNYTTLSNACFNGWFWNYIDTNPHTTAHISVTNIGSHGTFVAILNDFTTHISQGLVNGMYDITNATYIIQAIVTTDGNKNIQDSLRALEEQIANARNWEARGEVDHMIVVASKFITKKDNMNLSIYNTIESQLYPSSIKKIHRSLWGI